MADGSRTISWVNFRLFSSVAHRIGADVYYDYLEADVLSQDERFRRSVLLVRPTIAYLIRHSRGSFPSLR